MASYNKSDTDGDFDSLLDNASSTKSAAPGGLAELYVPPPNEVPKDAVTNKRGRFGRALDATVATAITAADAATFGIARPIMGVGYGLSDPSNFGEKFQEGYSAESDMLRKKREGLPMAAQLGAELVGGAKGAPGMIDNAIEGGLRKFAPKALDKAKNYAATFAAGIPVAVADRYMRNDSTLGEATIGGMFDSVLGTTLQATVGDVAMPFGQRMWSKVTGGTPLGSALNDVASAPFSEGMTLSRLLDVADKGIPEGKGILDLTVGKDSRGEAARRYYNALAKLDFADADPRKMGADQWLQKKAEYDATLVHLRTLATEANEEASVQFARALGEPQADFAKMKSKQPSANEAREVMNTIGRTMPVEKGGPVPLGAKPIDSLEFVNDARDAYLKEFGVNSLTDLSEPQRNVWNRFKQLFRGLEEQGTAKGVRRIESEGKDAPQADEIFGTIPLARLYNERKSLADFLTPGAMIKGSSVSRTEQKSIMTLMGVLDNRLDMETVGAAGLARGAFAKQMRLDDAYDLGNKFYRQRMSEVGAADSKNFAAHYGESLDELMANMSDPDIKEAFKYGFKNSISELTEKRSIRGEMRNFLGNVGDSNVVTSKTAGREQLNTILGEADANRLMDVYTNGSDLIDYRNKLVNLFEAKTDAPTVAHELAGLAMSGPSPLDEISDNSAIFAGLSMLRNMVKVGDRKKVDALMDLMTATGDDASRLLKQAVEEAAPGKGTQLGVTATSVISAPDDEPVTSSGGVGMYDLLKQGAKQM